MSHLIRNRLVFFSNNRHNPFPPCQVARVLQGQLTNDPVDVRPFHRALQNERNRTNLPRPSSRPSYFIFRTPSISTFPRVPRRFACLRSCKYTCITKLRARLISDLSSEPGGSSGTLSENGFSRADRSLQSGSSRRRRVVFLFSRRTALSISRLRLPLIYRSRFGKFISECATV